MSSLNARKIAPKIPPFGTVPNGNDKTNQAYCQYPLSKDMEQTMPKTLFYCRVSTKDQKLDLQIDGARSIGVLTDNIFTEQGSGAKNDRPVLAEVLSKLEPGDTLAAFKLDRIGRNMVDLAGIIRDLEERGVHFRTVVEGVTTQGAAGKLLLHMMAACAQFERDTLLERVKAGIAAAKERGRVGGRPNVGTADLVKDARRLIESGELNGEEVARALGVSPRTLYRRLRAAREHDAIVNGGAA